MAAHLCLGSSGAQQPLPPDSGREWLKSSTGGRSSERAADNNASARGLGQLLWRFGLRAPGRVVPGCSDGCAALNVRISSGAGRLAPRPLAGNRTGSYSAAAAATIWPGTATSPGGPGQLAPLAGPSVAGPGGHRLLRRQAAGGQRPRCDGSRAATRAAGSVAGSIAWALRTTAWAEHGVLAWLPRSSPRATKTTGQARLVGPVTAAVVRAASAV